MPVTVAQLVADHRLDLRLRSSRAAVDRPLSWVHVSELSDPTPFLQGGELLLTTGRAWTPGEPVEAYVRRLVAADVAALGVGTGLGLDAVPADLVSAAEGGGLAVLEIPRETPFIAISRTVSAALAADEYAAVAKAAAVQQELARAALTPSAPAGVVDRVARHVGGWAVLLDAAGSAVHSAPRTAAARVAGLGPDLDRLRGLRAPASAALAGPSHTVLLQSLGTGERVRGFLAVGRPGSVPAADRHVVNAAALLLTLRLEQSRALDSAMAGLRSALLELLVAGQRAVVTAVIGALGEELPAEPLRVVVVRGSEAERAAAVDVAADSVDRDDATLFVAETDGALVLLTTETGRPAERLQSLVERVPGCAIGLAPAVPWSGLAEGVRQARQAADGAVARGGGVVSFADLAGVGFTSLIDREAVRAFSEALLHPLVAADQSGPGDLVASLRVWLGHHGQWEPAAAQLGVHRHTLRKRMGRVAELLGRDLDSPGVRAELWLALTATT